MKKVWRFVIDKEYHEDDFDNEANAEENFINDLAVGNFEIQSEELEVDDES